MMNSTFRSYALIILLTFIAVLPAFSAESPVILEEVIYDVDGNTKEYALRAVSYIEEGQAFDSLEAMIEALELERQDLVNTRYFKDSVSFVYGEVGEGRYSATFYVTDAWTIIPIIYPKYDSNTGLRLGLQIYWDNFFGSMTNAYLGMNMDIRSKDGGGTEIGEWSINPKISGIRLSDTQTMSVGLNQRYVEEDFIDEFEPQNSYDYSFYQTSFGAGTRFELQRYLGYSLSLGMDFRYMYEGNLGQNKEQPYGITFGHGLGWGQVDWIENRRKGFSMSVGNPHRIGTGDDFFYITSIDYSVSAYAPFWKRFNYYTRFWAFYQYGEVRNIGGALRGVADNKTSGVTGFVLNNTLAFQFWRWEGLWDAQIHPFVDIGLAYNGSSFNYDRDFNVGAGFDLVLYLDKIPNLVARGTIGLDAKNFSMDTLSENLEIIISSSLFY